MPRLLIGVSRAAAIIVPVAAGALAITFSGLLAEPPAERQRQRPPTPVRVITLEPVLLTPRAVGYGQTEPAREWRAVARIEGVVAEKSKWLANGEIVPAGAPLLSIDDTDIRLSLAQVDAQLRALDIKDETVTASLKLAQSDLDLTRADLKRQEELAGRGIATTASLDQARRAELVARGKLTEYENQLALNDAERSVLKAQRATTARSLDFTKIAAPFGIRIVSVKAEEGQVVTKGQELLSAEGTEAVEIEAQFPLGRMGPVVRALGPGRSVMDLSARVVLPVPGHKVAWDAKVVRVAEATDARTQSSGVVVRVADPLGQAVPGQRPPLRRNRFVEVELSAPPRKVLAAPAAAVRNGEALFVTPENTLERRAVMVGYRVGDIAVLTGGVEPGDRLVVTDPAVAVPGMKVKAQEDKTLKAEVARLAHGSEQPK